MIDSYKFGEIIIDGKRYARDVIVLLGCVNDAGGGEKVIGCMLKI